MRIFLTFCHDDKIGLHCMSFSELQLNQHIRVGWLLVFTAFKFLLFYNSHWWPSGNYCFLLIVYLTDCHIIEGHWLVQGHWLNIKYQSCAPLYSTILVLLKDTCFLLFFFFSIIILEIELCSSGVIILPIMRRAFQFWVWRNINQYVELGDQIDLNPGTSSWLCDSMFMLLSITLCKVGNLEAVSWKS